MEHIKVTDENIIVSIKSSINFNFYKYLKKKYIVIGKGKSV